MSEDSLRESLMSNDSPPRVGTGTPTDVRRFETGATRSSDNDRYDLEGYLSPLALERFGEYMLKHQFQADGTKRDSDNWQKGMPLTTFAKGMHRHFLHFWQRHRGYHPKDAKAADNIEEDLCAIIFNAQGYLHEILKYRYSRNDTGAYTGAYLDGR